MAKALMPARRRRMALLFCGLAAAAWLAFFGDKAPSVVVEPRPLRAAAVPPAMQAAAQGGASLRPWPAAATPAGEVSIELLKPRDAMMGHLTDRADAPQVNLFEAARWKRSPKGASEPRTSVMAAAPPPTWPYQVAGKLNQGEAWEVFLTLEGSPLVARKGAMLEGGFRVEDISPPVMRVLHVDSGTTREISIGEAG